MTPQEQLNKWVAGESVHNDEREECCPDFSCCNPKINTPKEVKERFHQAFLNDEQEVVHQMLMGFLGAAFEQEDNLPKVHIAGDSVGELQ